jgi:hypothetical protein
MVFDGLTCEFGDGDTAPFGFVSKLGVEFVREFDCCSPHGMPAYPYR